MTEAAPDPMEKRASPRFPFSTAVMFEDYPARTCCAGRMVDYSRTGMRFETGVAPAPGSEIFIGMDRSPYSSAHDVFRAQVVWLRRLPPDASGYAYSVGVKYC
jgi:hypothetical protein